MKLSLVTIVGQAELPRYEVVCYGKFADSWVQDTDLVDTYYSRCVDYMVMNTHEGYYLRLTVSKG